MIKQATLLALALPLLASASVDMTNPVTGETETYENVFTGAGETATEWNSADNWTLKESGKVPFVSDGSYVPALVSNKTVSATTAIDGWTLRVGAYNGAAVTWDGGITKIQAGSVGCWLTADETSSITIASFAGKQLEGGDAAPFKLSSAKAGGITWSAGLTSSSNTSLPFWYYLKGAGTVVYGGDITVANAQVIKMADVTLSGNEKSVQSKTLVTFGSGTTKTFTADAAIKVKNSDGDVVRTIPLTSVTAADDTTLTTDDYVGTCELVQTSTGIVLYYVDGNPADITVYKPSININFTNGADNGLTTGADVGLDGYKAPGTSWNNFTIPNNANEQAFNAVNAIDSTGEASVVSGVSVTVSNHRGSYSCANLTAASNPLQSYIDEGAEKASPTVVITGIPYDYYRVIVYHSTDSANKQFSYDTINGANVTYVDGVLTTGTSSWGSSGADNSANAIEEGVNTLVSAVLSGDTATVASHRIGGQTPTARGCIAAIQIVEAKPDVGENDFIIEVSGDMTYTVSEAKTLSGTVYVIGNGMLTLDGSAKISAATIALSKNVTLNVNADRLDATTFTGSGTVVYDGVVPPTGKGWTESAWTGTVWIKNYATKLAAFETNPFGNTGSTLRLTGLNGYFQRKSGCTHNVPIELVDDGATPAWTYNDGWGGSVVVFATLKGDGTFKTTAAGNGEIIYFADPSGFTGSFDLAMKKIVLGGDEPAGSNQNYNGKLVVAGTATVSSASTWTAAAGFEVAGTLNVDGTLSSSASAAVTGSGTVVFGGVPSPTGDKWWKNAAWTGTVEIKSVNNINGNDYVFNDYGNSGSTLKLTNCTGWLKTNYTCVPALEIGGVFTWSDGGSGLNYTFKVGTLKGSGIISIPTGGAPTAVWQITDDWSGFTGAVVGNNTDARRVLVFGDTLPATIEAGEVYVAPGATLDLDNSSDTWWFHGKGFVVDGTVKATNRSKWGGGTSMVLGDTGVLEITRSDSASADDGGTDYSNVTGTGTIKFSGSGFTVISQSIPTSLTFAAEKDSGSVVPVAGATIGSLTGSKGFRSDWGNNGVGGRYLTIKQSKDTSWDGLITVGGAHRLTGVIVDPLDSATGTLTLTATQTASSTLTVNGAVNLTGTWVGATTVSGTFGGTGTLTGDLTFSGGATFKVGASPLTVSGNVSASGVVNVDISDIVDELDEEGKLIIRTTKAIEDVSNFALPFASYMLESTDEGLVVKPAGGEYDGVEFGVINVPGTVIHPKVTVDGRNGDYVGQYEGDECSYSLYNIPFPTNATSSVFITYEPAAGYVIVSNTVVEVENVGGVYWFGADKDSGEEPDPVVKRVDELSEVAFITDATGFNTLYATLDAAVAAVKAGETITVIHDASLADLAEGGFHLRKTTVTIDGYDCSMGGNLKIADGVDLMFGSGVTVTDDIIAMLSATDATITYPTNTVLKVQAPEGYIVVDTDNGDGTATITFEEKAPEPEPETTPVEDIIGIRLEGDDVIITTTPTNAVGTLRVSTDVAGKDVVERIGVTAESYETKYPKGSYPSLFFRIESESE